MRRKLFPGMKINKITLLEPTTRQGVHRLWKCKCDCGTIWEVSNMNLLAGQQSCGCARLNNQYETIKNNAYYHQKYGAAKRNLKWEISEEYYKKAIERPCSYCGGFSIRKNKASLVESKLNSLDRINNDLVYTETNTQSVCFTCQVMKMDMTDEEFKKHIKTINRNINEN